MSAMLIENAREDRKKKKNKSLRKDNKHADDNVTHRLLLVYFSSFFLVGIEINGKRK